MGVALDLVAEEAGQALEALADDRGPQVTHMHRLGHIGPAVVDHDPARLRQQRGARARVERDGLGALGQHRAGQAQIDEARAGDLH